DKYKDEIGLESYLRNLVLPSRIIDTEAIKVTKIKRRKETSALPAG
ncbi:34325_t:CDS:1, partial [Gigaspora margarita]